jgi:YVTN family beta-propeller protein
MRGEMGKQILTTKNQSAFGGPKTVRLWWTKEVKMKRFKMLFLILTAICSLLPTLLSAQWLETTIYPDSLIGVLYPRAFAYNATNNRIYVSSGGYGNCVIAIDGATNQKIARIPVPYSIWSSALVWNSINNKIYCAIDQGYGPGSVTMIDGVTNSVIKTITVGYHPRNLVYNPTNNKVYCANAFGVTVIDGTTDSVITTISAGNSPGALAYNPIDNKVYCANGADTVTVIDGATDSVITTVGVGSLPYALVYNPTNNKIYCANYGNGNVTIIDGVTDSVITTVPVGGEPKTLVYNPTNNKVYSSNSHPYSNNVTVIDGATNQVITTIQVGNMPCALAYNPTNNKVYCSNWMSDDVTVIDGAADTVITTVAVGRKQPGALVYNPFNNKIYCANTYGHSVSIIHGITDSVIITFPVGQYGPLALDWNSINNKVYCANEVGNNVTIINGVSNSVITNVPVGYGPRAFVYNPTNNKIYSANAGSNNMTVFDGATDSMITTVTVGNGPRALVCNPINNKIYCANELSNNVTIIDGATDSVVTTVAVGNRPYALVHNPTNNKVYCPNYYGNNVTAIDGVTNQVITTVPVGDHPCALVWNSADNKIYCSNSWSNNVTVIDGATDSVITTIPLSTSPSDLIYNPTYNKVYCASNNIYIIDGVADSVITTVTVGSGPYGLVYNPITYKVYCANNNSDNVTIIDGATDSMITTIGAGDGPVAFTYNQQQNRTYVANYNSSNISVIKDTVPRFDVAILKILAPKGNIPYDSVISPKAIVLNRGSDTAHFSTILSIGTVYSKTLSVSLNPHLDTTLTFPDWQTNIKASFVVTCSTMLGGDEYPSNDAMKKRIWVTSGSGPEIYSISPNVLPNGGSQTINITGERFVNGITAKFKKQWQPDIVADSIQFISSQEISAKFDLTNAAAGTWDFKVTNPSSDSYYFYQGFNIIEFPGRQIPYDSWVRFDVQQRDSIEIGVTVPSGISNMFVLVKKTTHYSHHSTWPGNITVFKDGNQNAYAYGEIDYGIHIKNPQPGWHILKIKNYDYSYRGEGYIKVCAKLDTLVFGEWRLGQVLRGWGNDWLQFDVPSGQDTLYLQTDGFGTQSTIDLYKDSLGSTQNHWFFGYGYHIVGHVANPPAGSYYLKYLDSDKVVGETSQVREYLIRASLDSIAPPPAPNLTITGLSTYKGGTAGPVTVIVSGTGLDTAATVSLVRSGDPTVTAQNVIGDTTRRTLWATFDLSSAAAGNWTFKVRNPNGDSAFALRPFVVEDGGAPDLRVEIIGRNVVRAGRPSTYIVRCSNQGNVNAPYTFMKISTPGESNNLLRLQGLWLSSDVPSWWDTLDQTVVFDGSRMAFVFVTGIPPGRTATLEVKLTMWNIGSFVLAVAGRNVNLDGFLSIQSVLAELTRIAILSDTLLPPAVRSAASDSAVWWNLLMRFMNKKGIVPPSSDLELGNVSSETWVGLAGGFIGMCICSEIYNLPGWMLFGGMFLDSFLHFLDESGILSEGQPPFSGWQPPPPYTGWQPPFQIPLPGLSTSSSTPEDKYGLEGYDPPQIPLDSFKRFVTADEIFPYRIDFWNSESATAPAQEVFIEDTLSSDFVDSTLNFTECGFLRWNVPLQGGQYFNVYVDMRPDDSLIVNIEGIYNQNSREITWTFRSLDPVTMQPPEDPMAGFLPPIDSTGYQIGWVNFTAEPYHNLPTGKQITNQSYVKFDVGPWKPAPPGGPYLNTIDAGRPTSFVRPLTDTTATGEFVVRWSGHDDSLGSGIRSYDIYVKTNNGQFQSWLTGTTDTMATFVGRNESRHYFYSIATDNVGWTELPPDSFDTRTFVTGIASPIYLAPEDTTLITDATPTFVWTATAGSQGTYGLQYSKDSSFVQGVITISGLADTTYTIPDTAGLQDTVYFWRAEAISRLGVHSGYRRAFRFTVDANAPEIPVLLLPPDSAITDDSTPTFIWSSTAGDSGRYLLQFATDSIFDSLKGAALTFDTTYTVSVSYPLSDTTYFWRVKAMDKAGNPSGYQAHPFRFTVSALREISGNVRYYYNQNPVESTKVIVSGAIADTVLTDSNGYYQLSSLLNNQNYIVSPEKINETREPAVTANDAGLILKHCVRRDTLDTLQRVAANVSGDSLISAYDAGLVLQYDVGMIQHFPAGDWTFVPRNRTYDSLSSNQSDQNYSAILYGDANGNWPGILLMLASIDKYPINSFGVNLQDDKNIEAIKDLPVSIITENAEKLIKEMTAESEHNLNVAATNSPIDISENSLASEIGNLRERNENIPAISTELPSHLIVYPVEIKNVKGVFSADLQISYNSEQLRPKSIRTTDATRNFMVAGADYGGKLRIGMASWQDLNGDAKLLEIVFEGKGEQLAKPEIKIDWIILNDGKETPTNQGAMGETEPVRLFSFACKPNPFNNRIQIRYTIPKETKVYIKVYNSLGQSIKTLVNGSQKPNDYSIGWGGKDDVGNKLANGIYFIRIETDNTKLEKKIVILRNQGGER